MHADSDKSARAHRHGVEETVRRGVAGYRRSRTTAARKFSFLAWGFLGLVAVGCRVSSTTLPEAPTGRAESIRLASPFGVHGSTGPTSTRGASTEPPRDWAGLFDVYRESLVASAPSTMSFSVVVPPNAWLDLALGTPHQGAGTFRVEIRRTAGTRNLDRLLERTVTRPNVWVPTPVDLSAYGGETVELIFALDSPQAEFTGFWGTAAVRRRVEGGSEGPSPRGVLLIIADTLRARNLPWMGYTRETAPFLAELASGGTVFRHCIAQATWTKPSVTSILTSMYPSTHAVKEQEDRLADGAITLAETFRDAGWATIGLGSIPLVGRMTNLEQGFEEFHEASSLQVSPNAKTARELVDRLLPWLEIHRDSPFFVLLHVSDPHGPYEPLGPYDTWWAEPGASAELEEMRERVKPYIRDAVRRELGHPTRDELVAAALDPDAYVSLEIAGYDGSIRGMDVELRRVFEQLRELTLDERVLVVFTSDHGEEFLEHGSHLHGHSVYSELTRVPLLFWGSRWAPERVVDVPVESLDILPTILDLAGLEAPESVQGSSLAPLFDGKTPSRELREPAVTEKSRMTGRHPLPGTEVGSHALVNGDWKLIRNHPARGNIPEVELYHLGNDPQELRNLADRHPDVVARLRGLLDRWEARVAENRLSPPTSSPKDLDEPTRKRLEALGYQ